MFSSQDLCKDHFPVSGTQRKVLDFNVIDTCSYQIFWSFQVCTQLENSKFGREKFVQIFGRAKFINLVNLQCTCSVPAVCTALSLKLRCHN